MRHNRTVPLAIPVLLALIFAAAATRADSGFLREFKDNYDVLLTDLSRKPPAELAEISGFVYQKDIATFTFKKGKMYFLRRVLGRPTTAIFIGEGNARMEIPVHTERQSLLYASGDSVVNEDFKVCFIRMTDDFDLKLREQFTFEETTLGWRDFNIAQEAQGEFFFKPVVMHEYDNLFLLLRSAYERRDDGYFWADFNRYVFTFDPNRPEQVIVAYEHEGGDVAVTDGAVLQRMENGISDDARVSDIPYPTTMLDRQARLRMGGLAGWRIDTATVDIKMLVNADSLRFVSLFLHYNIKLDSIYFRGQPVDYHRRRDFTFTGLILPEYACKGDTLEFRLWYHGKNYGTAFPFVSDPKPSPLHLAFDIPRGYNYIMPAMGEKVDAGKGRIRFDVAPPQPYTNFIFQPYASGFDTIQAISDIGLTLNFVKSGHITKNRYPCFIPDKDYRSAVLGAFNFMTGRLGMPPATFEMYVYPESSLTMPGLMEVPQVQCVKDETGGVHVVAGREAARQWFGALARPATDRESWLLNAVPEYLGLMYINSSLGHNIFFGELRLRRNYYYTIVSRNFDLPLAAGRRAAAGIRTTKGVWIMHMLRYLMYDIEKSSDRTFLKFIHALSSLMNNQVFTNVDAIKLAEKFYGEPLDWFFHHWLYSRDFPEYKVEYGINRKYDGYYVDVSVTTEKVGPEFRMPIMMRVEDVNGESIYLRQTVSGLSDSFALGPFATEPKELIFNEFFSVLSKDKVKKR